MILSFLLSWPWYREVAHLPRPDGSCCLVVSALLERRSLERIAVPPGWNLEVETSCAL